MSPIILYDRLPDVSIEIYQTIAYLKITEQERTSLEALWVRLDDLVAQMPEALHGAATQHAEEEA